MWNSASHILCPPNAGDQAWFPPQRELLEAGFFGSDEHWLICAPTGSGKTVIGEWAILSALQKGRKAAYLAPLKAIVEERLEDWNRTFASRSIGLFTGDRSRKTANTSPADHDLLLLTPEKLSSYLHNWRTHLPWLSQIDALVVDEIHLLGDSGRGAGLECLLTRWKRINPFTRIIGLTGTLSNAEEIADWLGARLYKSEWRPIPVEHRIVRFSKADQKPDLLLEELAPVVKDGGRALVFTNSRRRCEQLCKTLNEAGLSCAFTHAGLAPARRSAAQNLLREGKVDVLTTTSSLEMGVNFPARKVVIYDSYGFNGETFGPLPIARYLQAAGRAGRAGLDAYGESVLFLPKWAGSDPDYSARIPEPVVSGLFQEKRRTFEVLVDVSGRLSISEEHLSTNFGARSLWHRQGGHAHFSDLVMTLVNGGLLRRDTKTETYLSETALGRIACQMAIEPATIASFVRLYEVLPNPTGFDLLLTACWAAESTPKLGFNFEEIDPLTDTLLEVPSALLDGTVAEATSIQGHKNKRNMLAGLKSAILIHQHISGLSLERLAEQHDAYPYDLELLRQNLGRVLSAAQRIFSCLWAKQREADEDESVDEKQPKSKCSAQLVCEDLLVMVEYGVPRSATGLVRIPGIGRKRARKLLEHGITTPAQFTETPSSDLVSILGLKSIESLLEAARQISEESQQEDPFALEDEPIIRTAEPSKAIRWPAQIDPYRLRRALELTVDHCSEDAVKVSGGAEPHRVSVHRHRRQIDGYSCDCADFAKGQPQCKHILRARLELRDDDDLMPLLRLLAGTDHESAALRHSVGEIWMSIGGLYDRYAERQVDYSGQKFLRKATAQTKR